MASPVVLSSTTETEAVAAETTTEGASALSNHGSAVRLAQLLPGPATTVTIVVTATEMLLLRGRLMVVVDRVTAKTMVMAAVAATTQPLGAPQLLLEALLMGMAVTATIRLLPEWQLLVLMALLVTVHLHPLPVLPQA